MVQHNAVKRSTSYFSFHSIRYRPSGILIHRQNPHASLGLRRTGHREAQRHATGQQSKNPVCLILCVTSSIILHAVTAQTLGLTAREYVLLSD
jgi:hypothetical protein